MSDLIPAFEAAGAILLGVLVVIGLVAAVTVKRGEAALAKHSRR
jgi:hypothetical protein